jgi:hypothetical protein
VLELEEAEWDVLYHARELGIPVFAVDVLLESVS